MIDLSRPAGSRDPAGRTPITRRAALSAALAVTLLATTALGMHALRPVAHPAAGNVPAIDAGSRSAQDRGIDALQTRLRDEPGDWRAWAALGSAYVQQARISGDPTYYPKAEQSLRRALSLDSAADFEAMAGMGALAAARHDFAAALAWGNRARAVNPYSATVYGVIGDALVE